MSTVPDRANHPKRQVIYRKGEDDSELQARANDFDPGAPREGAWLNGIEMASENPTVKSLNRESAMGKEYPISGAGIDRFSARASAKQRDRSEAKFQADRKNK
jgi:hypothetical protein